jgi:AraC-like DNA-binding protein
MDSVLVAAILLAEVLIPVPDYRLFMNPLGFLPILLINPKKIVPFQLKMVKSRLLIILFGFACCLYGEVSTISFENLSGDSCIYQTDSAAIRVNSGYRMVIDSSVIKYGYYDKSLPFMEQFWFRFYFNIRDLKMIHKGKIDLFPFLGFSFFNRLQESEPRASIVMKLRNSSLAEDNLALICHLFSSNDTANSLLISPDIEENMTYCVEMRVRFTNDTLSCACFLNGNFTEKSTIFYRYPKREINLLFGNLGKKSYNEFLVMDFSDFTIAENRIPPIPEAPKNCRDSVFGETVLLFCDSFVTVDVCDTIDASRFMLVNADMPDFVLLNVIAKSTKALYRCKIPFQMDTGLYVWQASFQNRGGIWSGWSKPESLQIDTGYCNILAITNSYLSEVDDEEAVSVLVPGKWYDFHACYEFMGKRPIMDSYIIGWLRHESFLDGNYYNKGGPFDPARNFVLNISFNPEKRFYQLFEKTDSGLIKSSLVDFENGRIVLRFKFLENALPGKWFFTCYGYDPDDNRTNSIIDRVEVIKPTIGYVSMIIIVIVISIFMLAVLVVVNVIIRVRKRKKTMVNASFLKLSSYIRSRLGEKITVSQAMRDLGLSKRPFLNLVKNAGSGTFLQMINNIKVEEAKRLLTENKSVLEVSISLGFDNPGYFAKVFKDIEGVNPKEFQQKMLLS